MPKTWIKKSLVKTGALRFASRFAEPGVAILMYHSVMDDPEVAETTLGGIAHSKDVFRSQMEVIAKRYHAVNLDDVLLFLKGETNLPPGAVVVTFDDGYADNYQAAMEILSPMGIPGVFYVTVDCIDKQMLPWPSRLRHAILMSNKENWIDSDGATWTLSSPENRSCAFAHAAECCSKLTGILQARFVDSVYRQLETEPLKLNQRPMLTWDELRSLGCNGHTIGSHTMTHPNMAHIPENEMRTELVEAKCRIEQELGTPIPHFSYPCPALQPHWSDRTANASRQAGYATAVTTNGGVVRSNDNPLALRRIRPSKTADGLQWNLERAFLKSRSEAQLSHP
jgi:peptidoglycan/xylan/chitin deacetylase (PgdA/CDA1 family)